MTREDFTTAYIVELMMRVSAKPDEYFTQGATPQEYAHRVVPRMVAAIEKEAKAGSRSDYLGNNKAAAAAARRFGFTSGPKFRAAVAAWE